MQKDITTQNTLRAIILILFTIKLIVSCIEHANRIDSFYSGKILLEDPILILKLNLLFEPFIILLGIIGIFIRKKIGLVFMLLLPSLILTYNFIPAITPYFYFESVWPRVTLAIIFYFIINLKIIRTAYESKTIKQSVLLNTYAIVIGIIISVVMLYYRGIFEV